jgi:hypothetical protein
VTTSATTARAVPGWAVVLAAPLAALAVWTVAHVLLDVTLSAGDPPVVVGPVSVVLVSVVVALAAWGVRTLMFRRHRTAWFLTCGGLLLVSLLGPLGASTPAAVLWLAVTHCTVAALVALGLAPRRTV